MTLIDLTEEREKDLLEMSFENYLTELKEEDEINA